LTTEPCIESLYILANSDAKVKQKNHKVPQF